MSLAEQAYLDCGAAMPDAEPSQFFGKPCLKVGGKAFACFFQDCMVFKLTAPDHAQALALTNATLFDPSGKGRAMKEWVQVPHEHQAQWAELAEVAQSYVRP